MKGLIASPLFDGAQRESLFRHSDPFYWILRRKIPEKRAKKGKFTAYRFVT